MLTLREILANQPCNIVKSMAQTILHCLLECCSDNSKEVCWFIERQYIMSFIGYSSSWRDIGKCYIKHRSYILLWGYYQIYWSMEWFFGTGVSNVDSTTAMDETKYQSVICGNIKDYSIAIVTALTILISILDAGTRYVVVFIVVIVCP